MDLRIEASWHAVLKEELSQPYIQALKAFLDQEKRAGYTIYPPEPLIFHAFLRTPFSKVKVVIIGQDPYHGEGQAHGLSFSVQPGVPLPPSLKNIFLELKEDLGISPSSNGCLLSWADQGVLLLNAILTVRAKEPRSHHGKGWERLTDAVVKKLVEREDPLVFILWGKSAQEKVAHIVENKKTAHAILMAAHPSPYSAHAGFFGSRPFSEANAYLTRWGKTPIDWKIR